MGLLSWAGLRRSNQWELPTLLDELLSSPLVFFATLFYRLVTYLRGEPYQLARDQPPVRVVCISDTHDQKVAIPDGDILIHAGDLTDAGTVADIQVQIDWLRSQPHPVKVVIAGNHDSWFDPRSRPEVDVKTGAKVDLRGVLYLESSGTVQDIRGRKVSIFGVPDIPQCGPKSFAFQYTPTTQPWLSKIPPNTDILVTHCPPKHHLDNGLGDPHLLREAWRVRPRLHVFGHVHWGAGREAVFYDDAQAAYERIRTRTPRGPIRDLFPHAAWRDVAELFFLSMQNLAGKYIRGEAPAQQGGLMVNAAQMYGNTGKAKSRAVVVDI